MANPQPENGFVRIATPIMERLCKLRIPGEARQVLDFVIRKTWGFNKKSDIIPVSQFVDGTGLSRQHVYRARVKLLTMNLIRTHKGSDGRVSYSFQKDYDLWRVEPKKVHEPKKVRGGTHKGSNPNPIGDPQYTIDTSSKDKEDIPFDEIIADLNEVTKRTGRNRFRLSETIKRVIRARITDGYDLADFKHVHRIKQQEWAGTEFEKYINPSTLYRPSKFPNYVAQKPTREKPNVGHTSGQNYGPTGAIDI